MSNFTLGHILTLNKQADAWRKAKRPFIFGIVLTTGRGMKLEAVDLANSTGDMLAANQLDDETREIVSYALIRLDQIAMAEVFLVDEDNIPDPITEELRKFFN